MIGLRSAVASQALMVRPESDHYYPSSLANKPIAVQFHAGSHYTALRLLEGYIPAKKINLLHYGSPRYRFEAMMTGEVDAAMLMEPWIALAEKNGCRAVCEGHYLGAENASDNMDDETFAAINRAVSKAVDLINSDKKRFLHYLIEQPKFAGKQADRRPVPCRFPLHRAPAAGGLHTGGEDQTAALWKPQIPVRGHDERRGRRRHADGALDRSR